MWSSEDTERLRVRLRAFGATRRHRPVPQSLRRSCSILVDLTGGPARQLDHPALLLRRGLCASANCHPPRSPFALSNPRKDSFLRILLV